MADSFSGQEKSIGPYGPSVEGTHTTEQAAIQQVQLASQAAQNRAGLAQAARDRARPAEKLMTGTIGQAIDEFMGRGPAKSGDPTPTRSRPAAPRARGKGK